MDEVKEFIVIEEEEGDRLDVYLSEQLGDMSRSYIQKLIKDKKVTVNDKIEKAKYLVKEDDKIVIQIPAPKLLEVIPQDIPINIVYEDKDIIVINKSPNMVVHPTKRYQSGTLANGLLYYFKESNQDCIVRLVSRLDMDTSGLIIVAKNQYAHSELSNQMQNNNVEKRYLALVHGHFSEKEGTIDLPI